MGGLKLGETIAMELKCQMWTGLRINKCQYRKTAKKNVGNKEICTIQSYPCKIYQIKKIWVELNVLDL